MYPIPHFCKIMIKIDEGAKTPLKNLLTYIKFILNFDHIKFVMDFFARIYIPWNHLYCNCFDAAAATTTVVVFS